MAAKRNKYSGGHSLPEFALGKRDIASIRDLFSHEQTAYPEHLVHGYLDRPDRPVHLRCTDSEAGRAAKSLALEWAGRNWSAFLDPGQDTLIPPFHITRDHQFMGVLLPVRQGAELQGVLVVVWDLGPMIRQYIAPIRFRQYGAAYLIDDRGMVVYDHEEEIVGRNLFDGMHRAYPDLARVDKRLVREASGTDDYHFTVLRGRSVSRKLIAWARARVGDRALIVCLSAPDNYIKEALYGVRIQQIIAGVFLIGIMGVSVAAFFRFRQQLLVKSNQELKRQVAAQTSRLETSRERLALALEGGELGLWDWDVKTGALFLNSRWTRMLGYAPDTIDPHINSWQNLVFSEDLDRVIKGMTDHLKGLTPIYESEYRMVSKDGKILWVMARGKVTEQDKKGNPLRATGTHLDITERKKVAQTIAENEKKYRTLFESSFNAIAIIDTATGQFVDCNQAAVTLYDSGTRDALIGAAPEDFSPRFQPCGTPSKALAETYIRKAFEKGVHAFEWLHLRKDGTLVPVLVTLSAMVLGGQRRVLAIVKDISTIKAAEQEREALIAELKEALESVKTLEGLLPICAKCKKIRDDKGYWNTLEEYIESHSQVSFSHGLCVECSDELYGDQKWYRRYKKKKTASEKAGKSGPDKS